MIYPLFLLLNSCCLRKGILLYIAGSNVLLLIDKVYITPVKSVDIWPGKISSIGANLFTLLLIVLRVLLYLDDVFFSLEELAEKENTTETLGEELSMDESLYT